MSKTNSHAETENTGIPVTGKLSLGYFINIKYYDTNQSYKKQNPFASTKDLSCLDSVTLSSPNLQLFKNF